MPKQKRPRKILVIDIGGTNVKFKVWRKRERRKFPSGKRMTPRRMVKQVLAMTKDWDFDVISIGFPSLVVHGKPRLEPENLGKGWVGFDFEKAFGKPVKLMNDASMQALGSYSGGRMLFLGLGTGLGSTLILDDVIVPLELGDLSYSKSLVLREVLSKSGLKRTGLAEWEKAVHEVVQRLSSAFRTDYLVIGGGGAKKLKHLPRGARRGSNRKAFTGGARLWRSGAIYAMAKKHTWVIT